jgi:hypothetical protein
MDMALEGQEKTEPGPLLERGGVFGAAPHDLRIAAGEVSTTVVGAKVLSKIELLLPAAVHVPDTRVNGQKPLTYGLIRT